VQVASIHFKRRASEALRDERLQSTMKRFGGGFAEKRTAARTAFGASAFEDLRSASASIRDRALEHLDAWLLRFEEEATRRGTTVLWAESGDEACRHVLEICARHGLKKAIKSKSMLSEEAGLNERLAAAGVQPVETDLGEYILQLADEPPSHIIAPAIHKDLAQVSELFEKHHARPRTDDIARLTREARETLRPHFLGADLGIFRCQFPRRRNRLGRDRHERRQRPHVHDAAARARRDHRHRESDSDARGPVDAEPGPAALGDRTGHRELLLDPHRTEARGDADGPEHMYVVLVDNGRTRLVGSELKEMLRCIRCGACMNHCPVFHTIGGHAYGWVYPGRWARY
jgi:L-lactate dehydrogenase complex protein LldF